MRFTHTAAFGGNVTGPYTAEEAVARQVDQESALADGRMERLQARVESLTGIVGRLIQELDPRTHDVAAIIGHQWELDK